MEAISPVAVILDLLIRAIPNEDTDVSVGVEKRRRHATVRITTEIKGQLYGKHEVISLAQLEATNMPVDIIVDRIAREWHHARRQAEEELKRQTTGETA